MRVSLLILASGRSIVNNSDGSKGRAKKEEVDPWRELSGRELGTNE